MPAVVTGKLWNGRDAIRKRELEKILRKELLSLGDDKVIMPMSRNSSIAGLLVSAVLAPAIFAGCPAKAQNPISPMGVYIADPTARVDRDGKLYVYGSLDTEPGSYCSKDYHVLSSSDAKTWTLHPNRFSWSETLYAPDLIRKGDTYYLYFDIPNGDEFVAEGKVPTGPFGDAAKIEGPKQIDPNIFIDDDGQAYYFWGQFSGKGAKMNPDMKTLDLSTMVDGLVTEKDHFFHEGSFVFKRGKYYYYLYADISRNHRPTSLGYAMATSPLGPYVYKGVIIDNAGCDPETWNNHGSIVEYKGQWYIFYHRSTHASRAMRKACLEPITFNEDGTIDEVEMTSQGAGGPLDANQEIDVARACLLQGHARIQLDADRRTGVARGKREVLAGIRDGDAAAWKYLDFRKGAKKIELKVKPAAGGVIRVRTGAPDGPVLGTVRIPASVSSLGQKGAVPEWKKVSARIRKTKGVQALWLTFESDGDTPTEEDLFLLDSFRFR